MTTNAIYKECGSDWSHKAFAVATTQWLQHDQTLPLSVMGVACETNLNAGWLKWHSFPFIPSLTLTAAFQRSRHFWAKLFPRPFLARPEGPGVQTSMNYGKICHSARIFGEQRQRILDELVCWSSCKQNFTESFRRYFYINIICNRLRSNLRTRRCTFLR